MQRISWWIIGAAVTSAGMMVALRAKEPPKKPAPVVVESPTAAPAQAPAAEGTVFTFPDDDQMRKFAGLWAKREAALLRSQVLQSYLQQEQATLAQLDRQLRADYNVEPNKAYTLDTKRKVLAERKEAAAPSDTPSPEVPATP